MAALNIKATDREVQVLMKQMDTDNSGDIDYREFRNAMAPAFCKKYSRQDLLNAFKRFDINGDGYISTSELDTILTGMGRQISRRQLQTLVATYDRNGDGKLSFDEFSRLFD